MQVIQVNNTTVEALSATYPHDSEVSFPVSVDVTTDGYVLKTCELLTNVKSAVGSSITSVVLTDQKSLSGVVFVPTIQQAENLFFTHLQSTRTGLYIRNSINNTIEFSSELDNRCIFEISYISEQFIRVKFFDGIVYRFLTKNSSSDLFIFDTFKTDSLSANQIFGYLQDKQRNQIALFWPSVGVNYFFEDVLGVMRAAAGDVLNSSNIFNTRVFYSLPTQFDLTYTWSSYTSGVQSNTVSVQSNRSIRDLDNNFILFANHNDISDGSLQLEIAPLKNQLTQDNDLSRNNPYNTENEVNHRSYHSLNIIGDTVIAGYSSGIKRVVLASDQLTYFNFPYASSPFLSLNIKDSSLIKSGAIGGSTPIEADKVFKKRAADFGFSITNEENGTWLCAWLSASPTPNVEPVWMDRYYNPNFVNFTTALTAAIDIAYVDEFTNTIIDTGNQNNIIFDLPSRLIFEPHSVYAYHRIGNQGMQRLIDTKTYAQSVSGADLFRHADGTTAIPLLDKGIEEFVFTGNEYATIPALNTPGSFTVAFNLYAENYQEPFANQIFGNYNGTGIGIFNEDFITPFIIIPDGSIIKIYNTDFQLINEHQIKDGHVVKFPQLIAYTGFTPDYWIVDEDNILYNYNTEGLIQTKVTSPFLDGVTIEDIEVDNNSNVYLLVNPPISANTVYVYNAMTKTFSLSAIGRTTAMFGLSNNRLFVTPASAYTVATQLVNGNEAIIDNSNSIWFSTDNSVYKDVDGTFVLGISALNGSIETLNCDRDGNIWVLHSTDKLSKLSEERDLLFTATLTSTPLSGVKRYLDFVSELTPNGYEQYAIVLNNALSATSNVVKLDFDGKEIETIDIPSLTVYANLSGTKSITGFDNLRRYKNSTEPKLTTRIGIPLLYGEEADQFTFEYSLTSLDFGWHHVAIVFSAERGYATLYIDHLPIETITFETAKYTFSNIFNQPIQIGASSGYNNSTLFQTLKQAQTYLAKNCKVKDIRIYNLALSPFDVRNIASRFSQIRDVRWDMPVGQRSFLDSIERYFKFVLPGRKTTLYNITIQNSSITDLSVRASLEAQIATLIAKVAPIQTKLNQIIWRENE